MRALPKLLNDVDLTSRIQTVVGNEDWERILAFLARLVSGPSMSATAPMNGAPAN